MEEEPEPLLEEEAEEVELPEELPEEEMDPTESESEEEVPLPGEARP